MAQYVYSTGVIPGNAEVYSSDAAPVWPVTRSGEAPTNNSWKINSAVLKVCVRTAYGNPYYSFFVRKNSVTGVAMGQLTPDAGSNTWNYLTFSAAEIAQKDNFNNLSNLCLQGIGHTAMQIKGSTEITLTVNWSYTATACGAPTTITGVWETAENTAPISWSGATGGVNNSIVGYTVNYADFDHQPTIDEAYEAQYSYLTVVSSTSTSASANLAMVSTPGYYRVFAVQTRGSAGASLYSSWIYSTPVRKYTNAVAPQSIVPSTPVPPLNSTFTLSWTLAAAGQNDTIAGYDIYRSDTVDGEYEKIGTVETTETFGSYDTISPDVFNGQYFYKIMTLSATSELYNSPLSTVYAEVTSGYGLVTAPTNITSVPTQTYPGGVVHLTWSGAEDGYLNPISGYQIGRSTAADGIYYNVGSVTDAEAFVLAPSTENAKYYYKVMTLGTINGYNSNYSTATCIVTAVTPAAVTGGIGRTNALVL